MPSKCVSEHRTNYARLTNSFMIGKNSFRHIDFLNIRKSMKKLQRRFNNSHCFTLYDMFEVGPILISKQPNETCITVGNTLYRSKIYIDLLFPSSSTCKLGDEPMAKN